MRKLSRSMFIATMAMLVVAPTHVDAAKPSSDRTIVHKEVHPQYFPDDICGDRAGWTTFTTTWRFIVKESGDSIKIVFGETGRYVTDFDDPATEDYSSQFTQAGHAGVTSSGVVTYNSQFHDFPGTIDIHEHVVFVEVNGSVRVDRDVLTVTGCP